MIYLKALIFCAFVGLSYSKDALKFPPNFKFGAASAAYQIEGAWNTSGKGESIWDRFSHTHPQYIEDQSNGDIACDSYNNWKRDVKLAKRLGLHFYKFSISWPRLLPEGFTSNINKDAVRYYRDLIDELIEHKIEPVVTLYHWDLPQKLYELGGWTNPLIAEWFGDYATTVYKLYADRVKTWITIDEPLIFCDMAYNTGRMAPGIKDPEVGSYLCNKHALMAHAKAWRIYDKDFKAKYQGRVSLANHLIWHEESEGDGQIAEIANEYINGRYLHPIYSKEGGWPEKIKSLIRDNSLKFNFRESRLPEFTQKEIEDIRGTYDFFALSYYRSLTVKQAAENNSLSYWPESTSDIGVKFYPTGLRDLVSIHPEGIRKVLKWANKKYGNMNFFISGTGYGSIDPKQYDKDRLKYHRDHLEQILHAIKKDGINVTSYTAWSLMDGFEGTSGYKTKYGLFKTDFIDQQRRANLRMSGLYYSYVIRNHSLDVPTELPGWKEESISISRESQGENYVAYTLVLYLFFVMLFLSIVCGGYFMKNTRYERW